MEQIAENPYPQRFYGLSGYQDEAPFDASTLVLLGKPVTMEMVMGANEFVHSRKAIEHFAIDDIDSVITYKEKVNKRFPKKKYIEMSNQDFLTEIGACFVDSVSGEVKLRRGELLFVGQERTIKEVYPHYHLDYLNEKDIILAGLTGYWMNSYAP